MLYSRPAAAGNPFCPGSTIRISFACASLSATAYSTRVGETVRVRVMVKNAATVAALASKLTLLNAADGTRILPAYYSDNYLSLLPGESHEIEIEYPLKAGDSAVEVAIRGWNLSNQTVPVGSAGSKMSNAPRGRKGNA